MVSYSIENIRARVSKTIAAGDGCVDGDHLLNPELFDLVIGNAQKEAAVLIGFVARGDEVKVILTKRTEKLASHAGQVAFPGGKIDPEDGTAEVAALREAHEEIGLDPHEVEVLGQLPIYHSGSGFKINPVLALVSSNAEFVINTDEVEYMFEVPLSFLMDVQNHHTSSRVFQGRERFYYEMPYEGHYIWGVTAGMIRVLHDRIFKDEAN